jgi:tetratricopeptide (TPR) repeat protein/transcriptional regulator with XRE-family HTH domain
VGDERSRQSVFGALLREHRGAAGMTQEQLADRSGLSANAIGALERGIRHAPRAATVASLATALRLGPEQRAVLAAAALQRPAPHRPPDLAPPRTAGLPVPRELPRPPADFTGRVDELATLKRLLDPARSGCRGDPVVISAIDGMGGVGKSALAIHAAHEIAGANAFPDGQLYVNLQGATTGGPPLAPLDALERMLRSLGLEPAAIPAEVDEAASRFRSLAAERRLLVVLDDAHSTEQVRPLLPGSPTCVVLITSRLALATLEGTRPLHLDVLPSDQALDLLGRIAGSERVVAEPDAAERIVHLCGRLPLAVRIAGAVLAGRPHWPLSRLVRRLDDERGRLDELRAGDLDVRATFALSYRGLAEGDARVFRLLGLLPGPSFSVALVAALAETDADRAENALDRLRHAQLAHRLDDGRYAVHDLIRLFSRERLEREEPPRRRGEALERALGWHLDTARSNGELLRRPGASRFWPVDSHAGRNGAARAALAHFEAEWRTLVEAACRAGDTGLWQLAIELSDAVHPFFSVQGHYHWSEEERTWRLALRAARNLKDRLAESRFLSYLATMFRGQQRWHDAVSCYEQSLAISHPLGDRRGEARSLNGLGSLHGMRGQLEEARTCQERSAWLFRHLGDREGEGRALNNLGIVLSNQDRRAEALACFERSLALVREAGDRHTEGYVLDNLGDELRDAGRLEYAAGCYARNLAICEELSDPDCSAWALAGLADVRRAQGRCDEAMAHCELALEVSHESGDRFCQARALGCAGDIQRAAGRPCEAVAYYQRSLAIHRERGDPLNVCRTLTCLGETRCEQGRWAEAAAALDGALAIALDMRMPHEERGIRTRLGEIRRKSGRAGVDVAREARDRAAAPALGDQVD